MLASSRLLKDLVLTYQCAGRVNTCHPSGSTVEPFWFGKSKEPVTFHDVLKMKSQVLGRFVVKLSVAGIKCWKEVQYCGGTMSMSISISLQWSEFHGDSET